MFAQGDKKWLTLENLQPKKEVGYYNFRSSAYGWMNDKFSQFISIGCIFAGGPLIAGVSKSTAVILPNGALLSVGGEIATQIYSADVQEWDAEGQTWSLRSEKLPIPKSGPMTMVPDDWCNPNHVLT